jgi:purine nucleoside phosphorylase
VNTAFARFTAVVRELAPRSAVVLGSGLAGVTADFREQASVLFNDVPGLVPPTVGGHVGRLAVGAWGGSPVLIFFGRLHLYEGHPWTVVTGPVRSGANLGVERLILTNAAGGIHPSLGPGSLMAIRDHVKLSGRNAWRQRANAKSPSPGVLGCASLADLSPTGRGGAGWSSRGVLGSAEAPTSPPPGLPARPAGRHLGRAVGEVGEGHAVPEPGEGVVASAYSTRLLRVMCEHEAAAGRELLAGTYAALTGPSYETPAEIRALRAMGADAVGMSTAMEAEAAAALGLEVAAISCVTNWAAGLSDGPLGHQEVLDNAKLAVERLGGLLGVLVSSPGSTTSRIGPIHG